MFLIKSLIWSTYGGDPYSEKGEPQNACFVGAIAVPWWMHVLMPQRAKPAALTGIHRGDLEGNTDHPLQV